MANKEETMRADRLKAIREKRQLSQQDLADRVGLSGRQIWRYENGESDPTANVLSRLAKELEVSMDYLAGLVDEPQGHASEEELKPMERKLLAAYRRGDWPELMRVIGENGKQE